MQRRDVLMGSAALVTLTMIGRPASGNPALLALLAVNLTAILLKTGSLAEAINAIVTLGRTVFNRTGGDAQASEKDELKQDAAAAMYITIRAARHYWANTRNAEISLVQFQEKGRRLEHWKAFLHYTRESLKSADTLRIRLKQNREFFDKAAWSAIDEFGKVVGDIQKAQEVIVAIEAQAPPKSDEERQKLLELYRSIQAMHARAAELMVAIERYADTRPAIIPT